MRADVAIVAFSIAIAGSSGCGSRPDSPTLYHLRTIEYNVEFDGLEKRATVGPDHFLIVRDPDDIQVAEKVLRVGNRDYGEVKTKDKISVVGGKVVVNGQERKPTGPG